MSEEEQRRFRGVDSRAEIGTSGLTIDDLIAALQKAAHLKEHSAELVSRIGDILRESDSASIRNAAALALADLGEARGAEAIAEVLRRPDVAPSAGTPVYALNEMGAALPLDALATIVSHGSYESKAMAVMMIEDGRVGPAGDSVTEAAFRARFLSLAASDDPDTAEAAVALLDHFESAAP